jgi:post-segregation antitoxin (ccd killing protein)
MPDWKRLISERIGTLALSREARQGVIAELASHLEDLYQNCRTRGVNESQAIEIALSQAADWQELAREISDAKSQEGGMNDRQNSSGCRVW